MLAIGSIVAKFLGALYRVPLTNILGAEGMGMYQLVFPVFALFTVLSTAGIPTALSRIIAEKRAGGEPTFRYLLAAMSALVALGTVSAIVVAALAGKIAGWQGNAATRSGYLILAPTIILVAIIAGFRGWFQGELYMLPTAVSNIIEQLVKLAVGIALSVAFSKRGVVAAVNGAFVGIAVSELCALAYLVVTFLVRRRKRDRECLRVSRKEAGDMVKIALPIAAVALLLPLSSFFDSVILVNAQRLAGLSAATATARYGLLSGPVNSLINMPVVMIMSLAVVLVPAVSMSRVTRDIDAILLKSKLSVKLSFLIGIPCAFYFMVFAPRLISVIYPALGAADGRLAADLLRVTAANVVLLSAMQIYVSLLQALDRTKDAVISLTVAIVLKIALSFVLTRYIGILGGALASVCMAATAFVGVCVAYRRLLGIRLEKNIALNLVAGILMALAGIGISDIIKNNILAAVLGFAVCAVVYLWLAFLFDVIERDELEFLPMRGLLKKVRRAVRFWEYRQ